jgi:hypothetical protein
LTIGKHSEVGAAESHHSGAGRPPAAAPTAVQHLGTHSKIAHSHRSDLEPNQVFMVVIRVRKETRSLLTRIKSVGDGLPNHRYFALWTVAALLCVAPLAASISSSEESVQDFVKVRCSLDSEQDTFYTWSGSVFQYVAQQQPALLFKFIGFNVARCVQNNDGSWLLLSRELSYYLDPTTEEKLTFWTNPFTLEQVDVVHVSNDPVNNKVYPVVIQNLNNHSSVIVADVPLFYPNPLHNNVTFIPYGGDAPYYQAGEFFKFYFDPQDLNREHVQVNDVSISWSRTSQYLPWMKMASREGSLVYSCIGARKKDLAEMPQWLVADVQTRLPTYLHAPASYNPDVPNETSSTYFMKHFAEYLAGAQFPIPTVSK